MSVQQDFPEWRWLHDNAEPLARAFMRSPYNLAEYAEFAAQCHKLQLFVSEFEDDQDRIDFREQHVQALAKMIAWQFSERQAPSQAQGQLDLSTPALAGKE